jgi:hypothetical protein
VPCNTTNNQEIIYGSPEGDTINAYGGDDTIWGRNGLDTIDGGDVSSPPERQEQQGGVEQAQPEPQGPEDYVKLTGTAQGASCSVVDDKNQRSVDTRIPNTIKLELGAFSVASVSCSKRSAGGTMKLELFIDRKREASGQTSAQYGSVSLTYPQ